MLSIVIPTFNESNNIGLLIPKIHNVLKNHYKYEIIVVDDDSPDKTANIARKLAKKYFVKVLVRKNERGLASAVIDGFKAAKGNVLCVMDADLSHPPKILPKLIGSLNYSDIVVGSRLIKKGGVEYWPFHRKIISLCARLLARPLTPVKDSMSGFFALRKLVIKNVDLKAYGYKILLEILVFGNYSKVLEVPYTFLNRSVGRSKIGIKVEIEYLKQLVHLYKYKWLK